MVVVGLTVIVTMQQRGLVNQSAESSSCGSQLDTVRVFELQTRPDSLRERNVPLCGAVWPEMPPHDTHSHAYRETGHTERTKNRTTTLCQHQEGSSEWCASDVPGSWVTQHVFFGIQKRLCNAQYLHFELKGKGIIVFPFMFYCSKFKVPVSGNCISCTN